MTGTDVSAGAFALLLAVAVVLDLRGRRVPGGVTAAAALAAAMRRTPGRIVVFAGWIWLGVHFLAR